VNELAELPRVSRSTISLWVRDIELTDEQHADPMMVRFFVKFLRECFSVHDDRVALRCNLSADHVERQEEIEAFKAGTVRR
jgi:hypothetical protein